MGKKRLIVACDGTWVNSDNGFVRDSWMPWSSGSGSLANPSNVTKIARALCKTASDPDDADGIEQIVYYQAGIGSANNWYSFFGGFVGAGISENIREAYAFLCNNYEKGDEIFLIGFSRGAFTARSIGGLISSIGLLTKKGLDAFYPIFKDWENQTTPEYTPRYGNITWPVERPLFNDPEYMKQLIRRGLTMPDVPIKAIAVWDTVGSLGVPEINIWPGIRLFSKTRHEYSFINTEVAPNIENAFQVLALDEQRKPFAPTVWESPNPATSSLKTLRQCWFPGVHSAVGGGYVDSGISDLTLAWMITQLSPFLEFQKDYVLEQQSLNVRWYQNQGLKPPGWAMGMIKRSDEGFLNTLTGRQVRTPGDYYAIDPTTGKPTTKKLVDTHEFIHPSVRYRKWERGPGLANSNNVVPPGSLYSPLALQEPLWHYYSPEETPELKGKEDELKKWEGFGIWVNTETGTFIVEEKILDDSSEMQLVDAWPNTKQDLEAWSFEP